jgi:hypothetical protein
LTQKKQLVVYAFIVGISLAMVFRMKINLNMFRLDS